MATTLPTNEVIGIAGRVDLNKWPMASPAGASGTAPGLLYWAHSDSQGDLAAVAERGRARARAQTWDESEACEREFRAWLVDVMASIASVGPKPMAEVVEGDPVLAPISAAISLGRRFFVDVRPSTRTDDFDWQNAIVVALGSLASARGAKSTGDVALPPGVTPIVITHDADPPSVISGVKQAPTSDAGVLPAVIGAVVVVSCVGLVAGAIGWITSQYFEAKAVGVVADSKAKQAATAIQAAVDVVEKHQASQVIQGKTIPYDTGELAVLDSLRKSIKDLSGWEPPPLRSAPNLAGVASAAGTAIGSGLTIGTAIVLLVVAWLVLGARRRGM